jgi:integrase
MARIRSRGEGSISKRKDGRFEVRVSLGVVDGRRQQAHFYAKTRADAVELLRQARQEQRPVGRAAKTGAETVAQFMDRWLEQVVSKNRRGTFSSYESRIRLYINPVVGNVRLGALTREHVEQVEACARTRGMSPSSVHLLRVIFSAALNAAIKWERPGVRNVVRLTAPPKIEKRTYPVLSPDDARRLLDEAEKGPYASVYATMLYCGLRVGEALALRWADIDLERRTIHIEHSLTRGDRGKGAELGPTKTRDSKRTFDLSSIAAATLKEQRLNQVKQQAEAGQRGFPWLNDWGLVFTMPLGEPINPSTLLWDFGIRLNSAGLPPMRLHDLRHSCATLLHEAGVDWKEISHLMGHSKVSITQDLYAHMTPLLRQRTAEAMDQMFSRSSASPSPIA